MCARHSARPRRESFYRWGSRGSVRLTVKASVEVVRPGAQLCLTPNVPSSAQNWGCKGKRDRWGFWANWRSHADEAEWDECMWAEGTEKVTTWDRTCGFPERCL